MNEVNGKKIRKLANLTKEEIGKSEEDVKINFIVPLFEAFGHERLKFEHRWKDSLVENLDPSCKLVIETKNYDKDLDRELQQLEKYCHIERPLLGIIANGVEIRIFSYSWRFRETFQETLIYPINRKDIKDENVIQALENILSRDNLESGKAKDYVMSREKEIEDVERKNDDIKEESREKEKNLQTKIDKLNHTLENIKKQIEECSAEKKDVITKTNARISQIWQDIGFYQPPRYIPPKPMPPQPPNSKGDKSYTPTDMRFLRMLKNPNSLPSKIKRYIANEGEVIYKELIRVCAEHGYKSETSGSLGASVNVLEKEGHIKIEGRGDTKRLIFERE